MGAFFCMSNQYLTSPEKRAAIGRAERERCVTRDWRQIIVWTPAQGEWDRTLRQSRMRRVSSSRVRRSEGVSEAMPERATFRKTSSTAS